MTIEIEKKKSSGDTKPDAPAPPKGQRMTITQMKKDERASAEGKAQIEKRSLHLGWTDLKWETIKGPAYDLERLTGFRSRK